jgi:hypothetical protein
LDTKGAADRKVDTYFAKENVDLSDSLNETAVAGVRTGTA